MDYIIILNNIEIMKINDFSSNYYLFILLISNNLS